MFSRHFIDQQTLDAHKGTKIHKKRVKCLAEGAYTIEEANAAGGSGTSNFYTKKIEKMKAFKESTKEFKKVEIMSEQSISMSAYE